MWKERADHKKSYLRPILALVALLAFAGSAAFADELSKYEHARFGITTGTVFDEIVHAQFPNAEILQFNTIYDTIEALKAGKIDATLQDVPVLKKVVVQHPELAIVEPALTYEEYGASSSKDNRELVLKFNEFLKQVKADGTYDEMVRRWFETEGEPQMPEIELTGGTGTLKLGILGIFEPFAYRAGDNDIIGFDVELGRRFAEYLGMDIQLIDYDVSAAIAAVASGKCDIMISPMSITEERKLQIEFTDPYFVGGTALLVRGDAVAIARQPFFERFKQAVYSNLIKDQRYKLVLEGLKVTVIISVAAMLLGTLLGFLVCFMKLSRFAPIRAIAGAYTYVLRGTPMVVLLMLNYYVFLAGVDVNPILVAIITFTLNQGAFVGEIIRSAILTVDGGQQEAARSMGFSKVGMFFVVTLPQAVRVALPVYASEFISLVKGTAIVGYISIMDLTKAGDIIRSRTFDAYFPLLMVAVIYILITGTAISLMSRLDTGRRRAKK